MVIFNILWLKVNKKRNERLGCKFMSKIVRCNPKLHFPRYFLIDFIKLKAINKLLFFWPRWCLRAPENIKQQILALVEKNIWQK